MTGDAAWTERAKANGKNTESVAVANLIERADAGNQLFYALYHLPTDKVKALLANASPGFMRAWMRASKAFGQK